MKHFYVSRRFIYLFVLVVFAVGLSACSKEPSVPKESGSVLPNAGSSETESLSATAGTDLTKADTQSETQSSGQIYLYGEQHGVEKILDREYELWHDYYSNENMRHLFIEMPSYTAELLNLWMASDNNDILDQIYADWAGSAAQNPYVKTFYEKIKLTCPETIFHGTDVGHQYNTTGQRYLDQLKKDGLEDSEQYRHTQAVMEQGQHYYEKSDDGYRENCMVENFVYEYEKIRSEDIMGIYGSAHLGADAMDMTGTVASMENQLKSLYGDQLQSEDLSWLAKDMDPVRVDTMTIAGKEYEASYFGKQDLTGFKNFTSREFWRLENAYDDFKDAPKTGDVLPYDNYPVNIESGQVFVIDYTMDDGSVVRSYYRADGNEWDGRPATEGVTLE